MRLLEQAGEVGAEAGEGSVSGDSVKRKGKDKEKNDSGVTVTMENGADENENRQTAHVS